MRVPVDVSTGADSELVDGLRAGENRAFDRIYEQFNARLFSYLMRLARNRGLAEDLLQETWLRLASHAADLDDDTDLGAWLFTVARNAFLSEVRKAMTGASRARELLLLAPTQTSECPFELTSAGETHRRLEAALLRLPIDYREVLILVAVERLEPTQVARVLGLRPETVRKRLQRARTMLAAELERGHAGAQTRLEERHES